MKLLAPAKINLFLRVLSRRQDGFHEIETLFERIGFFDEITLLPAETGIRVETSSKNIPHGPKNIAFRAARLLKDKFSVEKGVVIRIQKNIPVSAGLGGGSSDAAAVLTGLNRLWKLQLSRQQLLGLGAQLGSDVPFFIMNTPLAIARGRGQILTPIKLRGPKIWHVIVKPPFGISTKQAYRRLAASRRSAPGSATVMLTPRKTNVKMLLHAIHEGSSERLSRLLTNSLELTGSKQVKKIFNIKDKILRQGAAGCLMSGSGSAVFGIFVSKKKALKAARVLRVNHKAWRVFVVSTY